jgi:nitroimidazol reductase NimA-like FMN-containing flavoprotein (pyridoxamine 5'-phosphate oxidase superfamily)
VTTEDTGHVVAITDDEAWGLLGSRTLGRLATSVGDRPDIFPVNYVLQGRTILIRTAEGTKLASAAVNRQVAFEADDHDVVEGWSVVVKGEARVLATSDELLEAERAQVLPWISTPKRRYLRITPWEITGRRFLFGAESDDHAEPA